MDLHLPGLDGIEATREIRRLPGDKGGVPIIALSASSMRNAVERARAAGMNAHLIKPIDPAALAAALAHYSRAGDTGEPVPPRGAIDEEHLRRLVDALGPAKVDELVATLAEDARLHRERLAEAQNLGDLAGVRVAAHALSGMTSSLGLTALSELTGAIEEACLEGQADRVAALSDRLDASMAAGLARLRALQL